MQVQVLLIHMTKAIIVTMVIKVLKQVHLLTQECRILLTVSEARQEVERLGINTAVIRLFSVDNTTLIFLTAIFDFCHSKIMITFSFIKKIIIMLSSLVYRLNLVRCVNNTKINNNNNYY